MRKKKTTYSVTILILSSWLFLKHLWIFLNQDRSNKHLSEILRDDGSNGRSHSVRTTTDQVAFNDSAFTRNFERRKNLREQCALRNNRTRIVTTDGFFDKKYIVGLTDERFSLVYCRINKAASWYNIHTLSQLLGWGEQRFRQFSSEFRKLAYDNKINIFKNAFSFHFVREPYGRLFSTYSNKFYYPKGNWEPVGPEIVRRYRKNPSKDSLTYGHDITFAELIRFTIEDFEAGNKMDAHIRPMHVNCKPCDYDYNFIGKLETMVSDWQYITEQMKVRNIISSGPSHPGQKKTGKEFSEIKHFFAALKKVETSDIEIYKLYKRAWRYFQMTSAISKHIEMPFKSFNIRSVDQDTFVNEMDKAADLSKRYKPELEMQKHEAMLQAYSTVPLELMEKLRHVVLEDCLLYGYDDRPTWLFDDNKPSTSTFNYFSDIN